jgi:hypothetical protein
LSSTPTLAFLIGGKSNDAKHLRLFLESQGTTPVIPNKASHKAIFAFDAGIYRLRNIIKAPSAASRTFVVSPRATTSSPETSFLPSASSPRCASGSIESTP